jgi:hypothetical protein
VTRAAFPFLRDAQEHTRLFKAYNRPSVDVVAMHVGVAGVPGRTFSIAALVQCRHLATKVAVVLLGHDHDDAHVSDNVYDAGSAHALEWGDANRMKYALRGIGHSRAAGGAVAVAGHPLP